MKKGVLLINLGTPNAPTLWGVWQYLRIFLADKRVISLPAILRYVLLYGFILPFRIFKTQHAYQSIWTKQGSPLRFHGEALCQTLQDKLGDTYQVALGMRYGHPSIDNALGLLRTCDHLTILPLYPQYSSAATGSSLETVLQQLAKKTVIPSLTVIRQFYDHPAFIKAQATLIQPYVADHEMLIFSYHGLPEQHLRQMGCQKICDKSCDVSSQSMPDCYRAQCYKTSSLLAQSLQLPAARYTTVFQSRLGRTPWIQPYMEPMLRELAARDIKNIAIACPSFVADCLETIEEIGIRAREFWQELGGTQLTLIPCLNANDIWSDALVRLITNPTNE
ncbi:MAG: ferrochelatase [Legionella sp.]|nr:MAG: ferrochelatase [Legionella sp.]